MKRIMSIAVAMVCAFFTSLVFAQDLPKAGLKIVGLQSHLNSFKSGEKVLWEETIPRESKVQVKGVITAPDLLGL